MKALNTVRKIRLCEGEAAALVLFETYVSKASKAFVTRFNKTCCN